MIIPRLLISFLKIVLVFILINVPAPSVNTPTDTDHISLMTYNIHRGRDANNKYTLHKMIQFMNNSDADVICLQEVMSFQSLKIKFLTEMNSTFAPNVVNPIYSYGLAIYSKYPITESHHISLTSTMEPRGFLHSVIEVEDNKILNVINVHLGLDLDERNIQINEILNYINILEGDTVVLGDFNQSDVYMDDLVDVAKHHNLHDMHSYSTLDARIDYIFIRDNQVYCSHYNVIEIDLSDHYPVLGQIK